MKTIELECNYCKSPIIKELREYKRQNKKHNNCAKFFCSKECISKGRDYTNVIRAAKINLLNAFLKENKKFRTIDVLSIFRSYIRGIKEIIKIYNKKEKFKTTDLTSEYLKQLWENQKGICPLTGVELIMAKAIGKEKNKGSNPYNASLDRIDSSKGYVQRQCKIYSIYG